MNTEKIISKLKSIENQNQIKILYACESGSRAWGFASPDSDFDIRFIYLNRLSQYLTIGEFKDTLNFPIGADLLDVSGWDVKKAFQLLAKSNAVLYEWFNSPIVYINNQEFSNDLKEIMPKYFCQKVSMHHYLGMTKKNFSEIENSQIKLKKYFYMLRAILASKWIKLNNNPPPIVLKELLVLLKDNPKILEIIDSLYSLKSIHNESFFMAQIPLLNDFITREYKLNLDFANSLSRKKVDLEKLNNLFLKLLKC